MSHVLTERLAVPVSLLILASGMASCGNSDKEKAESLFVMAEQASENGDYVKAIELIDSIDSAYPGEIATRRKATHLRPRVTELQTMAQLSEVDDLLVALTRTGDSLQQNIVKVDNPVEPYYVSKEMAGKSIVGSTGIEARMMPDGTFYLISCLKGHPIRHTSFSVSGNGESATTAVIPCDGERNDRSMGYEIIHFMPAECDSVSAFINRCFSMPLTLTFNGDKGSWSMPLNSADARSVADLYEAARNVRRRHLLEIERRRLEKQLDLSRVHQAKTLQEN